MTRDAIRDGLIAACYGLWAGLWAFASFAFFAALWWRSSRMFVEDMTESLPFVGLTVVVAALGWAIVHRHNVQPGPGAYIALAISVVVLVHLAVTFSIRAPPEAYVLGPLILFLAHFWFTVPVAAGATGLFVLGVKRLKAP
jgi:hypothetical protein